MLGNGPLGSYPLGSTASSATQNLSASYFTDVDTFYTPQLNLRIFASLFTNSNTFYTPLIKLFLLPSLLTNTSVVYVPTVQQILDESLFIDADTFYTPVITTGIVYMYPELFIDSPIFYTGNNTLYLLPPFYLDSFEYVAPPSSKQVFFVAPTTFNKNIRPTILRDGFRRKNPLRRGKKA